MSRRQGQNQINDDEEMREIVIRTPNGYLSPSYQSDANLLQRTRALFEGVQFNDDSKLELIYGPKRTALEHASFMIEHLQHYANIKASQGEFRRLGKNHDIVYEINDLMTRKAKGAGYLRLSGTIDVPGELLVAIMMDAQALSKVDSTIRVMDFVHAFGDGQTWLNYFRQSPGRLFRDVDGLDITGYRRLVENGEPVLYQFSVSVPHEIGMLSDAYRAVDWHWGYRLSQSQAGRTDLVLVCQTELNNYIPKYVANMMIGSVLADYVRSAEKVAREYIEREENIALIARYNLMR